MSRFKQALMDLYYLSKSDEKVAPHSMDESCTLNCRWIHVDRWFLCLASRRVHECGWYYCQCKWNQFGIYECSLTGHIFNVPSTASATKNKLLPGVLPAPAQKASMMPSSELVNSDILSFNLRARKTETALHSTLSQTREWLEKQPMAGDSKDKKEAVAPPKKRVSAATPKTNAMNTNGLSLVELDRQAALAHPKVNQKPLLSPLFVDEGNSDLKDATNIITPFLPSLFSSSSSATPSKSRAKSSSFLKVSTSLPPLSLQHLPTSTSSSSDY